MGLSFFLNLFFYISGIVKNMSLVVTSSIMAMSYFTSNHLFSLEGGTWLYVEWIAYDFLTIMLIFVIHKFYGFKRCSSVHYVYVGLTLNALLCFFVFVDIHILEETEEWWFWSVYSFSINMIDVMMVSSLILNRDFLSLNKALFKFRC